VLPVIGMASPDVASGRTVAVVARRGLPAVE